MLEQRLLERINQKKSALDALRPLPGAIVARLNEVLSAEWTYNSNAIEGNTLTLRETALILQTGITIGGKSLREHFEVINHQKAIDYVELLLNNNQPISAFHVRAIHQLVLTGIDDENAGAYRLVPVQIAGASYTPPEPWTLVQKMDEWSEYAAFPGDNMHIVEWAAISHHDLTAIHPFIDGNGRTARLVMNLQLMRHGYPPTIITKNDRQAYYRALSAADGGNPKLIANLVGRAVEHALTIWLEAVTPQTVAPQLDEHWLSLRKAAAESAFSQEYLSLLARKGRLEAIKRGRNWYTTRAAIQTYQQSVSEKKS